MPVENLQDILRIITAKDNREPWFFIPPGIVSSHKKSRQNAYLFPQSLAIVAGKSNKS
ncbi:hypothetical protein [Acinetobacter sp. ASP199]|uniref:hypothetical protein n=1 Tax=unclassified Acinetobacter TaxID=196816 RepID=UPI001F6013D8|nr:hypothetical protein [Acinetobacter sp. ASP199]UNT59251.1 hypothetical protein IHE35_14520 [Acinetobacter sp. ASP199]